MIEIIKKAFKKRTKPQILTLSKCLCEDELAELASLCVDHWSALTLDIVEDNFSAVSALSPEAFVFYLPGILLVGINEQLPGLLSYDSIVAGLDRSANSDYWDDHFKARWSLLSLDELDAVQDWILWMSDVDDGDHDDISLSRCFDTLDLLKARVQLS
ncbi:MAG: hypothetical protein HRT35_14195 [Algicola sp.]|nr:hypothetical protein [Algicola sp.]